MNKEFISKIALIQKELKAPKNQKNTFGNYNYRNQEDILEAVKPLLSNAGLVLTISDEMVAVQDSVEGSRVYVKATATITDGESSISNTAYARESQDKKGMDHSQITGATSSYARKYCLNGLFLIDDTKDADSMDNSVKDTRKDNKEEIKTTETGSTEKPVGTRFRRGAK